ncbi:MAG: hypothetical protein WC384_10580 [Prolixibacteraceae bacterium]|jgi:hypothetical protein
MKRILVFLILSSLFGASSFAQKMTGYGAELSILSAKLNVRDWLSKSNGFEVFGGISSELDDLNPDDPEVGFKFLHALIYERTQRTYIGLVGKWKWVNAFDSNNTNLPIPGLIIGKEWYSKRIHRRAFCVELGYQVGNKEYNLYSPINHLPIGKKSFEEFPLILNIRYSFYQLRK